VTWDKKEWFGTVKHLDQALTSLRRRIHVIRKKSGETSVSPAFFLMASSRQVQEQMEPRQKQLLQKHSTIFTSPLL
jgi:hypothetical protein